MLGMFIVGLLGGAIILIGAPLVLIHLMLETTARRAEQIRQRMAAHADLQAPASWPAEALVSASPIP